jgi:hypothetical protein
MRGRRITCTRLIAAAVACSLAVVSLSGAQTAGATVSDRKVGKFDPGYNTQLALQNPNCDPATGRFKFQFFAAPPCVKEWKAGTDNGGATAQGVDKNSIKVVVLWHELPEAQQTGEAGVYTNQATGKNEPGAARAALLDENEMFKHVYETWGRTVDFEFVESTGSDEAAQRADAVAVQAKKPFAVIDLAQSIGTPGVGGGRVFTQALHNAGIPYVAPRTAEPIFNSKVFALTIAEFMDKQLAGGKAEFADPSLASKPRKFGILHSSNFDRPFFDEQLAKRKLPDVVDAEYTIPSTQSDVRTDASQLASVIPTLVTKLKDAGVTTLIMQTNHSVAAAASKVMAQQEWFPEVILTSSPYQDLDLFGRGYDQKVWSHAFGMVWFPPYLAGAADPTASAFQWFWGTDRGTRWSIAFFQLLALYSAIQFIGPKLTAKAVAPGALSRIFSQGVAAGGWYSDSATTIEVRVAAPGEINPRGVTMAWYDPEATGPGNYNLGGIAQGKYVYLNEGKRYLTGHLPTTKQKFFDRSVSIPIFETAPASEPVFPKYDCVDCPSTGATDLVPAAAAS